jgi:hypothetical protein
MKYPLLIITLIFLTRGLSIGQHGANQYQFVDEASRYSKELYSELNKPQVYHGTKYVPVYINREIDKGNPYYLRDFMDEETVVINNIKYLKIPLMFDLIQNKIISVMPDNRVFISLVGQNIDQFTLNDHTFVNIKESSIHQQNFEPGFYDLLFNGNQIKVFAKRTKKYSESSNTVRYGASIQRNYADKTDIFILKEGKYNLIKKKKMLMTLMEDKRAPIESYFKREGLRSSKHNFENIVVSISKVYDSL